MAKAATVVNSSVLCVVGLNVTGCGRSTNKCEGVNSLAKQECADVVVISKTMYFEGEENG